VGTSGPAEKLARLIAQQDQTRILLAEFSSQAADVFLGSRNDD